MGGVSTPIMVSYDAVPYSDVVVSLAKMDFDGKEGSVDESAGITVPDTQVKLTALQKTGYFQFECAAITEGTKLKYVLSGTEKDYFEFSSETISVEAIDNGKDPETPKLTLTLDKEVSTTS